MSSAKEAFLTWRDVPVQHRSRVMFNLQGLIRCAEVVKSVSSRAGGSVRNSCSGLSSGLAATYRLRSLRRCIPPQENPWSEKYRLSYTPPNSLAWSAQQSTAEQHLSRPHP